MCLAVPMKLVEASDATGLVESNGLSLRVSLQLVPEVKVGDYVLVHAGFALTVLTEAEAQATISLIDASGVQRT